MTQTIITFGESMLLFAAEEPGDLAATSRYTRHLAGADGNVAIGLARQGFAVRYLSRVGADAFGRAVIATLAAEGVDTAAVARDPARPTGIMFKSRSADGSDPSTCYYRQGSAASVLAPEDFARLGPAPFAHLHISGITAALGAGPLALCHHALDRARACGASVSFDPNLRPALWPETERMRREIHRLAARCDWLLIGVHEAESLIGSCDCDRIGAFYLEAGAREVVIKLGADGAALCSANQRLHAAAEPVADVVDTVGAGDAFATGFISARLDGADAGAALARGNAFAARVIRQVGDYEGLPRRAEWR